MKKGELIVAALFMLISAIVIASSVREGAGWTEYGPAAGFVPFWYGVFMLVCSIWIFYDAIRLKTDESFFVSARGLWEAVRITFTATLLTLGIIYIGVYFSTFLYSILFARWLGKHRWVSVVAFGLIMTFAIYYGMEKGLKIDLPKSPLYEKGLFMF